MNIYSALFFMLLTCLAQSAWAVPMLYSFTGNVTSIAFREGSNSEVLTAPGSSQSFDGVEFTVGESVSYQFLIDVQRAGACVDPNQWLGNLCDGTSIVEPSGATFDYFYSDLISASKSSPFTYMQIEFNYGLDLATTPRNVTVFGDSAIWLEADLSVQNWFETMPLLGVDYWLESNREGRIESSLELVSIRSIPEPAALVLLCTGLLLLVSRMVFFETPRSQGAK